MQASSIIEPHDAILNCRSVFINIPSYPLVFENLDISDVCVANVIAGRMARVNTEGIGMSTRGYNNGTFFAFCSVHVGTGGAKAQNTRWAE